MKKIKVLHIITRLDPGGSTVNTIETVARLDKVRYETFLIAGRTQDRGEMERKLKSRGISFVFIDELIRPPHPLQDFFAFRKLKKHLRENHYDIVHTHSSKAGILGRLAARRTSVGHIVHTPHGHIFYGYFNPLVTGFFTYLEKKAARYTDRIITLTDIGKQDHVKHKIAGEEKFRTIYSGVDVEHYRQTQEDMMALRRELGFHEDDFLFGSVTRLDPVKGNRYLLEAYASVAETIGHSGLLFVGGGSEEKKLKQQARDLGVADRVRFVGFQEDVRPYCHVLDCFVLASLNEGMGRVVLEAMCAKKAVIASRTGGIPELVEHEEEGLLVEPGDAKALAEAMHRICRDDALRQKLQENAYRKVGEKFSLEKMIRDIESLYEELMSA